MSLYAQKLRRSPFPSASWSLGDLAGRFTELSSARGSASLTLAFDLVRQAQLEQEPVAWVTSVESTFYPPDVAQSGADLGSLVVVRLASSGSIPRAGEKLLRSGGFGLVVLDLGRTDIPMPLQTRLTALAHRHHAALLCLTHKESRNYSLGSLVSLRAHAKRRRDSRNRFACSLQVLKDKRRGPTWSHEEFYSGPAGLC